MPFGAELFAGGETRFRLWAPTHEAIGLELNRSAAPRPMRPIGDGWHELIVSNAGAGAKYRFVLPDGSRVPDPASRFQPDDVHGPSEVIDPCAYEWRDGTWRGRKWEEAVVYELHTGAFTPDGSFRSAAEKLDHLEKLGVTAVELMPVGDFPGRRNWGYDGVLPYAPDSSYGRPDDLKALIDAAHSRGIMVLLDVVYNHFGPEGAYIKAVSPEMFTSARRTPWGDAINLDPAISGQARQFFIHNALYWIEEFHFDGLRLDATHEIFDESPQHLLLELAERVRASAGARLVHLILENEENQASRLRRDAGLPRWYTSQWNDDLHHVLHVAVTGEQNGYYGDYIDDTAKFGRAVAEGFAFQGEFMPFRGRPRGQPSAGLPPSAFVAFLQNHDQVGNRAFGERITALAAPQKVRAATAIYLLLPQIPMLFMGEEWAAAQPFPFFCDFGPDLADAVRRGRRAEFARFPEFRDPAQREKIPDPVAEQTFLSAKLNWSDPEIAPFAEWLDWFRRIIAVRHRSIVPLLSHIGHGGKFEIVAREAINVRWDAGPAGQLLLCANLSGETVEFPAKQTGGEIWREGDCGGGRKFGPYSVRWTIGNPP